MSRLAPSREPAAWIGLVGAAAAFVGLFGVHLPDGFEAAAAALVTAVSAVLIRQNVRPAGQSIGVNPDTTVRVHEPSQVPAVEKVSEYRLVDGKVRQIGGSAIVPLYAAPDEVATKSRADLAKKPKKKAVKKR